MPIKPREKKKEHLCFWTLSLKYKIVFLLTETLLGENIKNNTWRYEQFLCITNPEIRSWLVFVRFQGSHWNSYRGKVQKKIPRWAWMDSKHDKSWGYVWTRASYAAGALPASSRDVVWRRATPYHRNLSF